MTPGVFVTDHHSRFVVRAPRAEALWLCLFEGADERRVPMQRSGENWMAELPGALGGQAYGYRAAGEWRPEAGLYFDPAKLLVDPFAVELDRPFVQDRRLAEYGAETSAIVPRAIVTPLDVAALQPPRFTPGGLIYELSVKAFTGRHPAVPPGQRGTVAALAHPEIIAHFRKLGVAAIELMPIIAWIDERHLPPLGLANAWGYNPVVPMALDPRLCPGGVAELRATVAALHQAGIGVILDIVLNHSGESDTSGGVIALRGLDNDAYAHDGEGRLINDSGCGNVLDFSNPGVRWLARETLRHFVRHCGVDGFRFDLAPILGRGPGFAEDAPFFREIAADHCLADRVMIAEPWDIGPGGYQLGRFPRGWLEWNDRFRDDVRRFWRGDGTIGQLTMRLAGSSDLFGSRSRSVNFLAAHDGFTLADTVAYCDRHNEANGENNRDGHRENHSWNHGIEGPSDDPVVVARRDADLRALLGTLFASTGTIMISAGDECGRSQQGNNNAYCQTDETFWFDWANRDLDLEAYVALLARERQARQDSLVEWPEGGIWRHPEGTAMTVAQWEDLATDGVDFVPADGSPAPPLTIRRASRQILLGTESQNASIQVVDPQV